MEPQTRAGNGAGSGDIIALQLGGHFRVATTDWLGTLRYMSPEQLQAEWTQVNHRSDIWSIGASLYEAATLELPFSGTTPESYFYAVTSQEPVSPRVRNRAVPRDLETVLLKCLERDARQRYSSAAELRDDLVRVLDERPVLARRPSQAARAGRLLFRHRRVLAAGAGAMVVAAGVVGLWSSRVQHRRDLERAEYEAVLLREEERGRSWTPGSSPGLTPDQNRLREAFMRDRLPQDLTVRFARYLLQPDIQVPAYVNIRQGRVFTAAPSPAAIRWHLLPVVQPRVALDSGITFQGQAIPPLAPIPVLNRRLLDRLGIGRHRLALELSAWFFDEVEVRPAFSRPGEMADVGWHYVGDSMDYTIGKTTPWKDVWPESLSRFCSAKVHSLTFPPKNFQIVNEIPPAYPAPVRSPQIDTAMRKSVDIERFYYTQPGELSFLLRQRSPPAPVAGDLEIFNEQGIVVARVEWCFTEAAPAEEEWRVGLVPEGFIGDRQRSAYRTWRAALAGGEDVKVRARFVAKRTVAIAHALDTYWDGTLEF